MRRRRNRVMATVVGGMVASAAAALTAGNLLWNRCTAKAVGRLGNGPAARGTFSRVQLADLPDPVVRYFEFALTPGQPMVRTARIEHAGRFRSGGLDAPWSRFKSVQHVSIEPPGFVWDAAIRMPPFLTVRVRDSYLLGIGAMQARVASLVRVVDASGGAELAAGSLHRYLAEAAWIPTALLPGRGVAWEPIDDRSARATLRDSGISVSLDFQFGERGEIVSVYTPARYRDVDGRSVPTPWMGHFKSYAPVDGMMVPMDGEVEWLLPEGRLPYWRGRIVGAEYGR